MKPKTNRYLLTWMRRLKAEKVIVWRMTAEGMRSTEVTFEAVLYVLLQAGSNNPALCRMQQRGRVPHLSPLHIPAEEVPLPVSLPKVRTVKKKRPRRW